jgi:hypothetical protein
MRIALSTSAGEEVVRRVIDCGMSIYWFNPMIDDPDEPGSRSRRLHEMNGLPLVNCGGNVGTACWMIADAVLNRRHVAVAGMDFSYYADTPYRNTQYYYEALELVGEDNLDALFPRIFNPHVGQWFYTDPAYLWFRDVFLQLAADASCTTYNCTGGGILFGARSGSPTYRISWQGRPGNSDGESPFHQSAGAGGRRAAPRALRHSRARGARDARRAPGAGLRRERLAQG